MPATDTLTLHGTAICVKKRGLLILGPSGSGKSGLALQLMALGAGLVSDDQVILTRAAAQITMQAPPTIAGLIEARGLGLLRARTAGHAWLTLAVNLGEIEKQRLPPQRSMKILEQSVPLVRKVDTPSFPAALLQYLKEGRKDADA